MGQGKNIENPVIAGWKAVHKKYRPVLAPCRKTQAEVLRYIQNKYETLPENSAQALEVGRQNAIQYASLFETVDACLDITVLAICDTGAGQALYATQQQDYADAMEYWRKVHDDAEDIPPDAFPLPILVFVDKNGGYVGVEGSPRLETELTAYRGLNEKELDNFYVVARYIEALEKMGWLEEVSE